MYGEGALVQVPWSLAYFHPQLVFASQWNMQESKVTSAYTIPKVLSLCKYVITLATVSGLHPSHLEYAAPVWDPYQQELINSLERVQKFALNVCFKSWSSGCKSLLQSCNLPTLASRRHYLKLCLLYIVVSGHLSFARAPIVPWNLSTSLRNTRILALERQVTCTNAHWSSFSPHTVTLWNSLPPSPQIELPVIVFFWTDCIMS